MPQSIKSFLFFLTPPPKAMILSIFLGLMHLHTDVNSLSFNKSIFPSSNSGDTDGIPKGVYSTTSALTPELPNDYYFSRKFAAGKRQKSRFRAILLCGGSGERLRHYLASILDSGDSDRYFPNDVAHTKQFVHIFNIPLFVYSLVELLSYEFIQEVNICSKPEWYRQIILMVDSGCKILLERKLKFKTPTTLTANNHAKFTDECLNVLQGGGYLVYDLVEAKLLSSLPSGDDFGSRFKKITFSKSGEKRQDSVYSALKTHNLVQGVDDYVFIHDAARPMLKLIDLKHISDVVFKTGAVVPVYNMQDTVKKLSDTNGSSLLKIEKTLDRSQLVGVQTPQCFNLEIIRNAYDIVYNAQSNGSTNAYFNPFTDDACFVEYLGQVPVVAVKGHKYNIKVTTWEDIELAKFLIKQTYFNNSN